MKVTVYIHMGEISNFQPVPQETNIRYIEQSHSYILLFSISYYYIYLGNILMNFNAPLLLF